MYNVHLYIHTLYNMYITYTCMYMYYIHNVFENKIIQVLYIEMIYMYMHMHMYMYMYTYLAALLHGSAIWTKHIMTSCISNANIMLWSELCTCLLWEQGGTTRVDNSITTIIH